MGLSRGGVHQHIANPLCRLPQHFFGCGLPGVAEQGEGTLRAGLPFPLQLIEICL